MFRICLFLSKVVHRTSYQRPKCQKTTSPRQVHKVVLCREFRVPCKNLFRNAFAYVFPRLRRLQSCKGQNLWVWRGLWNPTWHFPVWCHGKLCYFRVNIQWLKIFRLNKIEPISVIKKQKLVKKKNRKNLGKNREFFYLWESFEFFHPWK